MTTESADFLFRNPDILTELKTLEEDARREHAQKLTGLINDWTRRGLIRIYGRVRIDLQTLTPPFSSANGYAFSNLLYSISLR